MSPVIRGFQAHHADTVTSSFIPIIINDFGYSRLQSLLLTMPAGAIIGTVEITAPYLAYKYPGNRTYIIFVCQMGTVLAALLLWNLPRSATGGLLFACYILASFGGAYAVLMGIQTANTAGYTKKSVTASGIFLGYCLGMCSLCDIYLSLTNDASGNFTGPLLFRVKDSPEYVPGFIAVVITSIIAALLSIVYRIVCMWDNKRRDKLGAEAFDHAYEDDLTDMKVSLYATTSSKC